MTNLLEQAINCDDGERAAKIIQDAIGIESDELRTTASPRNGQWIANGALRSSANGSKRKRSSWLNAARAGALPAANGNCVSAIT